MWSLFISAAMADVPPFGGCGCSVVALLPIPVFAIALAAALVRQERRQE